MVPFHIVIGDVVSANVRRFWRQKTAAPTTDAAVSGLGHVTQLQTIRRYFASKTSGMPSRSFIPAKLFAFAETWMDFNLAQPLNMPFAVSGHSPHIVTTGNPSNSPVKKP